MKKREYGNDNIELREIVVKPGEEKLIKMFIDRLPTGTEISIPIYVFNGTEPGPVVLIQGGLHGDELNSTELIKRMLVDDHFEIKRGAAIVIPLLNVFGFIHFSRDVHGKDVNRKFPGTKSGSLASRMAYMIMDEIVTEIDFAIDCHTGGAQRANYPQIRYTADSADGYQLAKLFNAPFMFDSALISGSFREATHQQNIPIIVYEAGESMRLDDHAINIGINGILNVLKYHDMIDELPVPRKKIKESIRIHKRKWIRAEASGIFVPTVVCGARVKKGQLIANISDTYGEFNLPLFAPFTGFVIGLNNFPVVNLGDALFHLGRRKTVKTKLV